MDFSLYDNSDKDSVENSDEESFQQTDYIQNDNSGIDLPFEFNGLINPIDLNSTPSSIFVTDKKMSHLYKKEFYDEEENELEQEEKDTYFPRNIYVKENPEKEESLGPLPSIPFINYLNDNNIEPYPPNDNGIKITNVSDHAFTLVIPDHFKYFNVVYKGSTKKMILEKRARYNFREDEKSCIDRLFDEYSNNSCLSKKAISRMVYSDIYLNSFTQDKEILKIREYIKEKKKSRTLKSVENYIYSKTKKK